MAVKHYLVSEKSGAVQQAIKVLIQIWLDIVEQNESERKTSKTL